MSRITASPQALATPLKFAYWVPNVSGGLVVSTIEQRTGWDFEYNKKLARIAENSGFEYALTQTRYAASYGADQQHEATSFSLALLGATERLKVIAAVHPGMWHPGVLAKFIITTDHLSGGRAAVNIVSGWLKDEFTNFGLDWLEHDERYVRTEEFIRVLRGLWTEQNYSQSGKYYNINGFTASLSEIARKVEAAVPDYRVEHEIQPAQFVFPLVSDRRFREVTGYAPTRSLDDIIAEMAGTGVQT